MNDYFKDNFEQDYATLIENNNLKSNKTDGKDEINKMKSNPMNNSKGQSGKGNSKANSNKVSNAKGNGKSNGKGVKNSSSSSKSTGSTNSENADNIDQGGKYDLKKSLLNKFKFRLQKDSVEEAKAEAEANRCDPCNEFKAGNGLDFGCIDWGKCAFAKPCCKKFPYPCSCMAYMCFGVTFIGGLLGSIILF